MTNPGKTPSQVVPRWPLYRLTAEPGGTVHVSGPAAPTAPFPDRAASIQAVAALASVLVPPRPVHAEALDDDGTVWPLLIHPDGTATENGPAWRSRQPKKPSSRRRRQRPLPTGVSVRTLDMPVSAPDRGTGAPVPAGESVEVGAVPLSPLPQDLAPPLSLAEPIVRPPAAQPAAVDHDEPTTRVRRRQPVTEQHERPAKVPPVSARAQPEPLRKVPAQTSRPEAPSSLPSALRISHLAEAGRLDEALTMAVALDDATARTHGPSHRAAIEVREVRAHITAASGDLPGGIALYRDAAERWALQGEHVMAGEAAGRAHALWMRITDPAQAITTGETIVRMRSQIPGPNGVPYRQATRRLDRLRDAAAQGS